jgi:prevent-host-death family protein
MTSCDHDQVMKRVKIAELKAHLSKHLRAVRAGQVVTVVDRETPIARIIPFSSSEGGGLVTRAPLGDLRKVRLPPPLKEEVDSLAVLLEERQVDR